MSFSWTLGTGAFQDDGDSVAKVAWGSVGMFVAVGYENGTGMVLASSPDGEVWTMRSTPMDGDGSQFGYGVIWAEELGLFFAFGTRQSPKVTIMSSPDGIAWTAQPNDFDTGICIGMCWSPDLELLVATGVDSLPTPSITVMTSPDGTTWTPQTAPTDGEGASSYPAWISQLNLFVVPSNFTTKIMVSNDGVVWDADTVTPWGSSAEGFGAIWSAAQGKVLAYGNDFFAQPFVLTSPDGLDPWTGFSGVPFENGVSSMLNGNGVYVAGDRGGDTPVAFSFDEGLTWTLNPSPFDGVGMTVGGLAYSPDLDKWVAGGSFADGVKLMWAPGVVVPPSTETQYQRIFGWRLNISDDALETVDPMLTSPQSGSSA